MNGEAHQKSVKYLNIPRARTTYTVQYSTAQHNTNTNTNTTALTNTHTHRHTNKYTQRTPNEIDRFFPYLLVSVLFALAADFPLPTFVQ